MTSLTKAAVSFIGMAAAVNFGSATVEAAGPSAAPLTFNAPTSGSLTLSNLARVSMTPARGGTSLFFAQTEKVTLNANGVVVRWFFFSDFSCSR